MSMLSAQCDELRERAKELRNLAPDPTVPYLVPSTKEIIALAMQSAASEMMDAADTIWELRDSVHCERAEADRLREQGARLFDKTLELGAENDRLRERITTQKQTIQAYRDESREWREVAERAQAENAKLRELVRNVHTLHWSGLDCTECPWFDECDTTGGCPWLGIFADHMRELGIEVN